MPNPTDLARQLERTWTELGVDPSAKTLASDEVDTAAPIPKPQALVGPYDLGGENWLQIEEVIGVGGMGVVHAARQVTIGRTVAVKTATTSLPPSTKRDDLLLQEGRITGLLEHPNIVPVYAVGHDARGRPMIVMKRVEGTAWSALMERQPVDARMHPDVYLLGATLHELLTGAPPHAGGSVREILMKAFVSEPPVYSAQVPEELGRIATRALARDSGGRFESALAFATAIDDFLLHRDALELNEEAARRTRALEALIAAEGADEEIDVLFYEARFAYGRALHVWDGNGRAREGRLKLLERMATCQVERGRPEFAISLLRLHDDPPELLWQRATELFEQQASERARIESQERRRPSTRRQRSGEPSVFGCGGLGATTLRSTRASRSPRCLSATWTPGLSGPVRAAHWKNSSIKAAA